MLSPDARAGKERIFSTAVRPKVGKKVTLDENSNSGPPTYRGTERRTETKYTCCAWAGGIFFPVVLLCQFFVLREIGLVLHTDVRYLTNYFTN